MKQKHFTETITTDAEGLIGWYESLMNGDVDCIPIRNTPKFKADAIISYEIDGYNVELKYDFTNIKPL